MINAIEVFSKMKIFHFIEKIYIEPITITPPSYYDTHHPIVMALIDQYLTDPKNLLARDIYKKYSRLLFWKSKKENTISLEIMTDGISAKEYHSDLKGEELFIDMLLRIKGKHSINIDPNGVFLGFETEFIGFNNEIIYWDCDTFDLLNRMGPGNIRFGKDKNDPSKILIFKVPDINVNNIDGKQFGLFSFDSGMIKSIGCEVVINKDEAEYYGYDQYYNIRDIRLIDPNQIQKGSLADFICQALSKSIQLPKKWYFEKLSTTKPNPHLEHEWIREWKKNRV